VAEESGDRHNAGSILTALVPPAPRRTIKGDCIFSGAERERTSRHRAWGIGALNGIDSEIKILYIYSQQSDSVRAGRAYSVAAQPVSPSMKWMG